MIRKIKQAFEDEARGTTQMKVGYNRFKDDHTSLESESRSDRASASKDDIVIDQVRKDPGDSGVIVK